MPRTLRITETAETSPGRFRIEVALEGDGPRRTASATFELALTPQDREDLRWYLEDYLLFPLDPAPKIAARIEQRLVDLGDGLFRAVFHANDAVRDLWALVRDELSETRVEIVTDVRHAGTVPWELLRDLRTGAPIALTACAFVRAHSSAVVRPRGVASSDAGPIRILLVIARPRAGDDVPFRSVAKQLLLGLDRAARERVQLDVLRPPTFAELGRVLGAAKDRKEPYHVVHFDGHGAYLDEPEKKIGHVLQGVRAEVLGAERAGKHGYLVFEGVDEPTRENGQLIDGPRLGRLLVEAHVPVLVLNACRSAHADPPAEPERAAGRNTHDEDVARFGSLALEVMHTGVSGVVAMQYNVYVATAAQLVRDLYDSLGNGVSLGDAVTRGRKQLYNEPKRSIGLGLPRDLQDWCVPVVYEAMPVALFAGPPTRRRVELPRDDERETRVKVPPAPDTGFFGRDETLLALDRAFDEHRIVLLHAFAGSGKTCAATEFARWYARTGGVGGPVLFTSFEFRKTLGQALNDLAGAFKPELQQLRVQWGALDDEEKRGVALQLLRRVQVLWIWDNVEPVAGFPAGAESAWSVDEQWDLADFLREARTTRAKVLLTSRRDEQAWLGELPARIKVPPMGMLERVEMARSLASKRGARLEDMAEWQPLPAFTQGNPLAITVLVGQALREGVRTKAQVETLVARLREGENAFEDDEKQGKSRSLGASLSYGFASAFGPEDGKRLSLLHLFQGFVDVWVLRMMGEPATPWCLPKVRGLTEDAWIGLLSRAAEIGLLTALGPGFFAIHPAVPWFLRKMFAASYPEVQPGGGGSCARNAERAYVEVMGELGESYLRRYVAGHRDMMGNMAADEPNLLHARELARKYGWWRRVVSAMQGLRQLHEHAGRKVEWARLVEDMLPDFVDPAGDGPLPGREDQWGLVTSFRVQVAMAARRWAEAERLQEDVVRWERERAADAMALPAEALNNEQRHRIGMLAVALERLGSILRERGSPACIVPYEEGAGLAKRVGDRTEEAAIAFNLGHSNKDLRGVDGLAQAKHWYERSLELQEAHNLHHRGKCHLGLGNVAYEQFSRKQWSGDAAIGRVGRGPSIAPRGRSCVPRAAGHHAGAGLDPSSRSDSLPTSCPDI